MAATLRLCLKLFTSFLLSLLLVSIYTCNYQRDDSILLPLRSHTQNHKSTPLHEPTSHYYITEQKKNIVVDELDEARKVISNAIKSRRFTSEKEGSFVPRGSIYHNAYAFYQSHTEMVKKLKVWTYREGGPPLVHEGPTQSIYGIEGFFIQEIERGNTSFSASHAGQAHVFFLPISVGNIVSHLYDPLVTYDRDQLIRTVNNYTHLIAHKYPFWNRTNGADHLLLSCHDWAPDISKENSEKQLYTNIIRGLCNANKSEHFNPSKDVSIPEINLRVSESSYPRRGEHPKNRSILAFFAGGIHGSIRETLINSWKGKDKQIQVYEQLPPNLKYLELMERSKFCLCPSGFEVASPRTVEAIYASCVPVIIADDYELPFSDVLDWSKFSLHVGSEKILELKRVLQNVKEDEYLRMQRRVIKVQRHFEVNRPTKEYDVFHMILHSVWLRRINMWSIRT